ncbi:hypothetical protein HELRODRAFT_165393 [Helobdella robusta]|uniref:Endonuclease/exonuclease/phosphatase domain-containing protein n=1 Tax=Helobdella robusta TaxID=6412 RepID=T1EWP8_HELRO|nr:hypothetical protein HELRODRAFT_165393 [Helobdella robusta]ESN91364.1 hypothetical protein HELRODRAFT_165393 [Helobdella robusta]
MLIRCDLNGHVGEKTDGFDNVHRGFGYGERNEDGNRILEFAVSHGFCLLNPYFRKRPESSWATNIPGINFDSYSDSTRNIVLTQEVTHSRHTEERDENRG